MNYYLKGSIAIGVLGALVYSENQSETQPHAQYIAVSPANNLVASGANVNVSASTITYTYQPSPVALEYLLPHDRLVIQDTPLTPPTAKLARSIPTTGANPFFRRRHRAPRLEVQTHKLPSFWCASFQKFRSRMLT